MLITIDDKRININHIVYIEETNVGDKTSIHLTNREIILTDKSSFEIKDMIELELELHLQKNNNE